MTGPKAKLRISAQQTATIKIAGRAVCAGAIAIMLSACARPQGDFGRAQDDLLHETAMPALGAARKAITGNPVSSLPLTDSEKELYNRAWALVFPPSQEDWLGNSVVEMRRTHVIPASWSSIAYESYYEHLLDRNYQASQTHYTKLLADIQTDRALIPPYCRAWQQVREADSFRKEALHRAHDPSRQQSKDLNARIGENRQVHLWVQAALSLRFSAFSHALDRLTIDVPDRHMVWTVHRALVGYKQDILDLDATCEQLAPSNTSKKPRKSRILTGWGLERPAPKK
ncbi:hypothetical protein [Polycladidibacter hongkongensis]|uniref:hypothetical protein n=1 Tax=Polycladidibacter hongkongensis TaxID=1647556 RepID=UPI000ACF5E8D|nr:hypothetical protein [Pseudovibrio hongkongensis]